MGHHNQILYDLVYLQIYSISTIYLPLNLDGVGCFQKNLQSFLFSFKKSSDDIYIWFQIPHIKIDTHTPFKYNKDKIITKKKVSFMDLDITTFLNYKLN